MTDTRLNSQAHSIGWESDSAAKASGREDDAALTPARPPAQTWEWTSADGPPRR
jgi:hypothetical protein